jgi:adenylate cyclase
MSTISPVRGHALFLRYCGHVIPAFEGQRLLDAILTFNPEHRHLCGGNGFCTTCRVEVLAGEGALSRVSALERERLGRDAGRLRLACQTTLWGNADVRVPPPRPSLFPPNDD